MYTNVNLAAPVGALAFLGTCFLLFIAALLFVYSLVKGRFHWTKLVLLTSAMIVGIYVAVILVFSFAGSERVLARGQEKHFCEIDCHLAYSITDVSQAKTLGNLTTPMTAVGVYTLITVKTRFDETTISTNRGNGLLYPNSRVSTIIDEQGRRYSPALEAQRALAKSQGTDTPLTAPLRPGDTYKTTLVFDLPVDVKNPTLLITEGEWITHFVIGHENSLLHKKTRFQIF